MEWDYDIAEAATKEQLFQMVAKAGRSGWKPEGGITQTLDGRYLQALIKPAKAQPDPAYIADQLQKLDEKMSAICVAIKA